MLLICLALQVSIYMKDKTSIMFKTYIKATLFFIAFMLCSDCSLSPKINSAVYHDKKNPCSSGEYSNSFECEHWKKKYPKEYQKYIKRLEKVSKGS